MSDHIAWTGTRLATVLWLMGAVLLGSWAQAGSIEFAPEGSSGSTYTIGGIDQAPGMPWQWAPPLTVGATFQLDYQANIPALIGTNGLDFTPAGLGSTYQLTVVGSFTEVVTSLSSSGSVATFAPCRPRSRQIASSGPITTRPSSLTMGDWVQCRHVGPRRHSGHQLGEPLGLFTFELRRHSAFRPVFQSLPGHH